MDEPPASAETAPEGVRPDRAGRVAAALSLLAAVGTYLAAQIDFYRRHRPGIEPLSYWRPQLMQVLLPGVAATALLAMVAFVLCRRKARR